MTENNSYIKSAVFKSEYNSTAECTILNAVVTFLISFGVLQQLVTVTKADCSQIILALTTAAVSFAMFIAGKYSKLKIIFYLLPVAVAGAMLLTVNVNIVNVFSNTVNGLLNTVGEYFGVIMPQLQCSEASAVEATLFFTAVSSAVVLFNAMCFNRSIAVLPAALAVVTVLLSAFVQGVNAASTVLVFSAMVLILYKARLCNAAAVGKSNSVWNKAAAFAPMVVFTAAVIVVGCVGFSNTFAKDLKNGIQSSANDVLYGNTASMPQGRLNNAQSYKPTNKPMLKVVMSSPQSYYLRGFVGGTYNGSSWQRPENKQLYKSADLFYWLHRNNFYGYNQLSVLSKQLNKDGSENRIIINNVGASTRYMYTPYELDSCSYSLVNKNKITDTAPVILGAFGQHIYTYTAVDNQVKQYTSLLSGLYNNDIGDKATADGYMNIESHYSDYVYENYLYIPQKAKTTLEGMLGSYKSSEKHLQYSTAKQSILNVLSSSMEYSTEPDKGSSDDFATAFLQETHQGYSVHFATAAALMLRYYGIPARYVEGYLITPDDVKDTLSNSEIVIDDAHSHAWAEYYLDGVGWIPFEATPPYIDVMESAEDILPSNSNDSNVSNNDSSKQNNATESYEQEPDDDSLLQRNSDFINIIIYVLLVIALLAVFAAIFILLKNRLKRKRLYASFNTENNKASVINGFGFCVYLLIRFKYINSERGIYSENIIITKEYTKKFIQAFNIYQAARYSNHTVGQQQAEKVLELIDATVSCIKKKRSFIQKFYDIFIACVYK